MLVITVLFIGGLEKHLGLDLRLVNASACPHTLCSGICAPAVVLEELRFLEMRLWLQIDA